jgi:DNA-binding transcriptional ArsR family regulator
VQPIALFKCLSDPTRLRITLLLLERPELCVCELCDALLLGQSKISRHLALLRGCELLADRRQGQWVYYRLHPELPAWSRTVLEQAYAGAAELVEADLQRLGESGGVTGACAAGACA